MKVISESYAVDTQYGLWLRSFGYIPAGILMFLFCFLAARFFPANKQIKLSLYGIGIFYGLGTVITGIFPCDSGCNRDFIDPSHSQIIHNLVGLLTYVFVPSCLLVLGLGLKKTPNHNWFSLQSIGSGVVGIFIVLILFLKPNTPYIGLIQRLVEIIFATWILSCALMIKKKRS